MSKFNVCLSYILGSFESGGIEYLSYVTGWSIAKCYRVVSGDAKPSPMEIAGLSIIFGFEDRIDEFVTDLYPKLTNWDYRRINADADSFKRRKHS